MKNKSSTIAAGVKTATDRLQQIPEEVVTLTHEKRRLSDPLLVSIDEQVHRSDEKVDETNKKYWTYIGNLTVTDRWVRFPDVDHQAIDLGVVDEYFCGYFPDHIKKVRAEKIRAAATGAEMPAADIARRIAEIDRAIETLWIEYEELATELEASHLRVERDARLPVAIFLNFDPTEKTIDDGKLDRLRRRRPAFTGEHDMLRGELEKLREKEAALQTESYMYDRAPRGVAAADLEGLKSRMARNLEERQVVEKKMADLTSANSASFRLLAKCEEFVKKNGIGVKFAGMAELTTG